MHEPMTEIVDADFERLDLVKGGANGAFILLAKSQQPDQVKKAQDDMADDDAATMTPDEAIDQADDDAAGAPVPTDTPGDPNEPGSPAWEAVDAARARSAVASLVALKSLVCDLADRETAEAAEGDGQADDNAWDLAGVLDALDCALACLAKFAVDEQAEADEGVADIEAAARAIGLIKSSRGLADAIVKAGRVLSSANEQALREAAAAIEKVLASLPAAQPEESAVTKSEQTTTDTPAADTPTEPVAKAGTPQVAVYDASGKLVGTVDPGDLNPIAAPEPPAGGDAQGGDDTADDTTAAPAEETAPAQPADLAPAPPADAGTPADATDVAKSTEPAERVPDTAELHALVKSLQGEIEELKAPARSKVLSNGALPPAHLMRGQDRPEPGAPSRVDGDELRKSLANAGDASQREEIANRMNEAAIDALTALRATPRR